VFHVADARAMPFDDGEFDAIVSKDTFVNIVGKAALIAELHRVLRGPDPASGRSGGRLAFTDWMAGNPEPTQAYHDWRAFKKEEPFDKLSLDGYERLLRDMGFEIIDRRDRGDEFRQHVSSRFAAFRAADPAEMHDRFGIEDHDYFVKRFGLTLDMLLAKDVIWGQITAEKR
jgi:ubiquinone/menaquinone biosynthesis C-methylase UbiE